MGSGVGRIAQLNRAMFLRSIMYRFESCSDHYKVKSKPTHMFNDFKNLVELQDAFPTQESCLEYLKAVMWNGKPAHCPRCECEHVYPYSDKHTYRCSGCDKKFNVLTKTIFENTKVELRKWFSAIYLASTCKRGVSSVQLAKLIGVTQKTSWFILHRLREMFSNLSVDKVEGLTCVDETYVGGKYKNKHRNKRKAGSQGRSLVDKVLVFGAMEVDGNIKTKVIPKFNNALLVNAVKETVAVGSTVMSDELHAYNHIGNDYYHDSCNHNIKRYVSDTGATTNPIENAWSHLKRTIIGTYYHVSPKHIGRYLKEFEYKYNTRKIQEPVRFRELLSHCVARLKYKDLIR